MSVANIDRRALVSKDELAAELKTEGGPEAEALDRIRSRCSDRVWAFLRPNDDRGFPINPSSAGGMAELYSPTPGTSALLVRNLPLLEVVAVWESTDEPRVYDSGTALTEGTHYVVRKNSGEIVRIDATQRMPTHWETGWRTVRYTYRWGWASVADVESTIADITLQLCAMTYRDRTRGEQGLSSITDAGGTVARFNPARLTPTMKDALRPYRLPPDPYSLAEPE